MTDSTTPKPEIAETLRSVLDRLVDGVVTIDSRGTVETFNPAAEHMFGYSTAEVVGRNVSMLMPAPHRAQHDGYLAAYLKTGEAKVIGKGRELEGERKDGGRFPLELGVSESAVGGRTLFTGVIRDITERKAAERALAELVEQRTAELRESEAHLLQAQKMESIGRLAGGIAHDFNNLLTAIISFTRFVYDDLESDDARREDLREVLKAADSAARLTDQLLAFSRPRPIESRVVDLNESVRSMDALLRRTIGADVQLALELPSSPALVRADPGQLEQLILNLAVNARDAMPRGGHLRMSVATRELGADGLVEPRSTVSLEVQDTGEGIEPDVVDQVFEPFFSTKEERGTGLGLATCYSIVRQAGGDIQVSSAPGAGATFTVLLPSC